jgi:hypothetical protein
MQRKTAHKATQTMKDILQPMNTMQKKEKTIPGTDFGGL